MDGDERAQAGIDRMAETQHAALPQQDVVRQADDDQIADLAQHGQRQAAGEQVRRDGQRQREQRPDDEAADIQRLEAVGQLGRRAGVSRRRLARRESAR
ncbi:hypothetical protein D3C85_1573130 [compost metagenome]